MRYALHRANETGAKWKQMFRPGYNDHVNEAFRVGCNSCILSRLAGFSVWAKRLRPALSEG